MSAAEPATVAAAPAAPRRRRGDFGQEGVLAGALVLIFVVVGLVNERFLSAPNLITIFSTNSFIAVAAIGMTMVIICRHIDVAVGSLIGVLAIISGTLAVKGWPIWLCWTMPIALAIAVNAAVGALVAYARIPSIVVTLGMLSILKGGLISVTGGTWISDLPADYFIAQQRLFGIPVPVCLMVVLTVAAAFWMRQSAFGRSIYAIGSNPEAARAAGIRLNLSVVGVFAIHGFFVGIAAVLYATQLQVIQSTVPPNLELTIIAASVVGGVSILGGRGRVVGSTLAAILFAAIGSALVFVSVSAYWLRAVQGALILATVLADMARRRGRT